MRAAALALGLLLGGVACSEPRSQRCGNGGYCPAGMECSLADTCRVRADRCGGYPDGTPCVQGVKSICLHGACVDSVCGDGFIDLGRGEQCDLVAGNLDVPGSACRSGCLLPACGDGVVDSSAGETCDDGAANSGLDPGACRLDCRPARCGDGVRDPDEAALCFGAALTAPLPGPPRALLVADLDGDGVAEVASVAGDQLGVRRLQRSAAGLLSVSEPRRIDEAGVDGLALGDFDRDGRVDLATTVPAGLLLVHNTVAALEPWTRLAISGGPRAVAVTDLDGDGLLDAATANNGAGDVSLLRGLGDGRLQAMARQPVAAMPLALVAAQFDDDRRGDLITLSDDPASFPELWLGDGAFGLIREPFPIGLPFLSRLALGDFDGDGSRDVAITGRLDGAFAVIAGAPLAPTRLGQVTMVSELLPRIAFAVDDLEGDGRDELMLAASDGTLHRFDGQQVVPLAEQYARGGVSWAAAGELSGDCFHELVLATTEPSLVVLPGGDGVLCPPRLLAPKVTIDSVHVGNFDGDGLPDVIARETISGKLLRWRGTPRGGLLELPAAGIDAVVAATLGDVDGDGQDEIVAQSRVNFRLLVLRPQGDALVELDREAFFASPAGGILVADFTGDGYADVVVHDQPHGQGYWLWVGMGGGHFARDPVELVAPLKLARMLAGDVDRDGKADLVAASQARAFVLRATGTSFEVSGRFNEPLAGPLVALLDVDGDGDLDVVRSDPASDGGVDLVWMVGAGDGSFRRGARVRARAGNALASGDFNGDGRVDIALAGSAASGGGIDVFLGIAGGRWLSRPQRFEAPEGAALVVHDLDGDGRSDVVTTLELSGAMVRMGYKVRPLP